MKKEDLDLFYDTLYADQNHGQIYSKLISSIETEELNVPECSITKSNAATYHYIARLSIKIAQNNFFVACLHHGIMFQKIHIFVEPLLGF